MYNMVTLVMGSAEVFDANTQSSEITYKEVYIYIQTAYLSDRMLYGLIGGGGGNVLLICWITFYIYAVLDG